MDLGYKPEPMEPESAPTTAEKEPEERFPTLSLQDGSVDKLKGDHQCAVGDEYIADGVRLRVKAVSDDNYGKRLEFDVLSIDEFESSDDGVGADTGEGDPPDPAAKKTPKALRY